MNKYYINKIKTFLEKNTNYYCLERGGGVEPCFHIKTNDYIWIMTYCREILKQKTTIKNIKEKIYINRIQKLIWKNRSIYSDCEYGLPDVPFLLNRMTKYYYKIMKYLDKLLEVKK